MQHCTESSARPLMWELAIPHNIYMEALERSVMKGAASVSIYENTNAHAYMNAVMVFTAVFSRHIKLVHFENNLLHIFLDGAFSFNDGAAIRRLFETTPGQYQPDRVLHDVLISKQAMFNLRTTRDVDGEERVVELSFADLKVWEGEVDYRHMRQTLIDNDIVDLTTKALVYEVQNLHESVYEQGAQIDNLETPIIGSKDYTIDTLVHASKLAADPLLLRQTVRRAEEWFKKSKFKSKV